MKKITATIILYSTIIFAQNSNSNLYTIVYSMKNQEGKMFAFKLALVNNMSIYSPLGSIENLDKNFESQIIKDMNLYKKYSDNTIIYSEQILGQKIIVKDSLSIFDWKLNDETNKILNHNCNSATTKFRGREYKAFYTNDIVISDGPWKFSGLPGLILKIESLDREYVYEAIALKNNIESNSKNELEYTNTLKKDFLNWDDFEKLFIKKMNEHIKNEKASLTIEEAKYPNYFKYSRPEIIYKDLQLGDGIKY